MHLVDDLKDDPLEEVAKGRRQIITDFCDSWHDICISLRLWTIKITLGTLSLRSLGLNISFYGSLTIILNERNIAYHFDAVSDEISRQKFVYACSLSQCECFRS